MADRLKGKVALVTGAGSSGPPSQRVPPQAPSLRRGGVAGWGNGKATAVLFAREGAKVFAVDRDPAAVEETRAIICGEGGECTAHVADVTAADQVAQMVAACLEAYGRIDVLHNNVGVLATGGPVELAEEEWDRLLAVNVKSMFLVCKHVLPVMERQGAGAIVNVSSITSLRWIGYPCVAYAASKGAVNELTRNVALQYAAKGIRANAILPGLINTPMIREPLKDAYGPGGVEAMILRRDAMVPMGRMGDAWDVAYAALFLASDEARYVTGAELVVDGGLTCTVAG